MSERPLSDLEKAIAAAKAQGLTRYRVIKRGREVVIEVDEGRTASRATNSQDCRTVTPSRFHGVWTAAATNPHG